MHGEIGGIIMRYAAVVGVVKSMMVTPGRS